MASRKLPLPCDTRRRCLAGTTTILASCWFACAAYCQAQTDRAGAARSLDEGRGYLEQAKYAEAIEAFTSAIESDPGSIEAHERRAQAYSARGQHARSEDDRETAARLRLARNIQSEAPLALAQSAEFWIKLTAILGAGLVIAWLCVRRFNILRGAKAPEWHMMDRRDSRGDP
jgi:tetratricopeptide (TPR) repeat protein